MKEMIKEYEEETKQTLVQDEPRCPICGAVLDEDDCYDYSYGGSYMERLLIGSCPDCDTCYQWKEVFFYGGCVDVQKSED